MSSTFEKYGGFKTVSRVVMTFYEMVLDNDDVGHHFDDVDMARLIDHQTKFISALMGGPEPMSDDRLEYVHRKHNITDTEFDIVCDLLAASMKQHGMDRMDIREVVAGFEAKRALIISSGA